jgi:hypothetical protein
MGALHGDQNGGEVLEKWVSIFIALNGGAVAVVAISFLQSP